MLRPDSTHLFVVKYGDQCAGDATESGLTAEQQSDANVFIFFRNDLLILALHFGCIDVGDFILMTIFGC